MKRVLVTGGGGFIANHLITRLVDLGCKVRALCRRSNAEQRWLAGVEVVEGDVRDEIAMKRAASEMDTIFHLASKVHESIDRSASFEEYKAVNVTGTRNLLEGAVAGGARRFVLFSSVKAMGERTESCQDEVALPRPETPYGKSKLEAERLVIEYGNRYNLHGSCLRLPLVYGPGQKGNLARMFAAIDRGGFPPLPEFGNRRSMVHVDNVARAAFLAAIHPAARGQCYIVTDGLDYSTRELYELIAAALKKPIPRWRIPAVALRVLAKVGDIGECVLRRKLPFDTEALDKLVGSAFYSSAKIVRELGYAPKINFHSALPELTAWYRQAIA